LLQQIGLVQNPFALTKIKVDALAQCIITSCHSDAVHGKILMEGHGFNVQWSTERHQLSPCTGSAQSDRANFAQGSLQSPLQIYCLLCHSCARRVAVTDSRGFTAGHTVIPTRSFQIPNCPQCMAGNATHNIQLPKLDWFNNLL